MYARIALLALLLVMFASADCLAANPRSVSVQVKVVTGNARMAKRLLTALDTALTRDHYSHAAIWPDVRLVVFAMPDINNKKNPQGWSFAIAQAVTSPLLMAVPTLLNSKHTLAGFEPGPRLAGIFMHSTGILTYLNVMNIDHLDTRNFPLVVGAIVNTFTARWPAVIGGHAHPKPMPQEPSSFRGPPVILIGGPSGNEP